MTQRDRVQGTSILIFAAFLSMLDRSLLPPLLPVVAEDFGEPIESVGLAVTAYVLGYAVFQILWSIGSMRWGRVRIIAFSTLLAGVGNVVSAIATDGMVLLLGRSLVGAAFAATIPAVLVFLGDTMSMKQRTVAAANLAAALSLGMTIGTIGASAAGEWLDWRLPFWITAAISFVVGARLFWMAEPGVLVRQRLLPSFGLLIRNRPALGVLVLVLIEGIVFLGIFSYLPVALQAEGESVVVSGLVTAVYGIGVIVFSQYLKIVLPRLKPWSIMLMGGLIATAGYALLGWRITALTVLVAAIAIAFAWATSHTSMQAWITDAARDARTLGVSLFAVCLFLGSALGTMMGNAAAAADGFSVLFWIAVGLGLLFTVAATLSRARYRGEGD